VTVVIVRKRLVNAKGISEFAGNNKVGVVKFVSMAKMFSHTAAGTFLVT
jgi:hypothetical protein